MKYYAVYLDPEYNQKQTMPAALFLDKDVAMEWAYQHALAFVSIVPVRLGAILPPTQPEPLEVKW